MQRRLIYNDLTKEIQQMLQNSKQIYILYRLPIHSRSNKEPNGLISITRILFVSVSRPLASVEANDTNDIDWLFNVHRNMCRLKNKHGLSQPKRVGKTLRATSSCQS
ncbi:hypothetical protein V8G54_016686 [Vigna mungo]|uniref:Uncharacterized protein n=1 Tax=Vigna mungo TaxID=3915 RepID=A0AAQ3NNJ2_VIGMU